MFSSLVISLIIIVIGGSSSDFVLYLSYQTVLISTRGLTFFPFSSPSLREWGEEGGGE